MCKKVDKCLKEDLILHLPSHKNKHSNHNIGQQSRETRFNMISKTTKRDELKQKGFFLYTKIPNTKEDKTHHKYPNQNSPTDHATRFSANTTPRQSKVYHGKIFVLGGLSGAAGWPATSNSWVYDPQKDSWSPLAPVPSSVARGAAGTGTYKGIIYLGGGILSLNGPTVDIVSAYEIASNKWIDLPAAASRLPGGRDHTATVQIGSKLYMTGGRENGATNTKDTVFILDMANVSVGWQTARGKMPTARGGLAAAAVGHRIYTFGGEGNTARGG